MNSNAPATLTVYVCRTCGRLKLYHFGNHISHQRCTAADVQAVTYTQDKEESRRIRAVADFFNSTE